MNGQPLSSIDMKKIVDSITVVYNARVAEEKKRDTGKKKGKDHGKDRGGKGKDTGQKGAC